MDIIFALCEERERKMWCAAVLCKVEKENEATKPEINARTVVARTFQQDEIHIGIRAWKDVSWFRGLWVE